LVVVPPIDSARLQNGAKGAVLKLRKDLFGGEAA
jgi:hypothetical protein